MRIGGGGSTDINLLQSDAAQFRNTDFVTENDGAFMGGDVVGAVAAEVPIVQLFNPAGSTIDILIDQITIAPSVAMVCRLARYATEATSSSGAWQNKKLEQTAGQGIVRTMTNGTILGTLLASFTLPANVPFTIFFNTPLLLEPDTGVLAEGHTVNTAVYVSFQGREV